MIPAITRRRVILVVATGLLLVTGIFAAVSFAGSNTAADQCGKPLSERVGGWVCPGP
jgi:hypothetical protein